MSDLFGLGIPFIGKKMTDTKSKKWMTQIELTTMQEKLDDVTALLCLVASIFTPIIISIRVRIITNEHTANLIPTAAAVLTKQGKLKIVFNPYFVKDNNVAVLKFAILHEAFHILSGHLTTSLISDRYSKPVMQAATDHVINNDLTKLNNSSRIKMEIPDWVILYDEIKSQNMSVLEVYEWLLKNKTVTVKMSGSGDGEIEIDIESTSTIESEGKTATHISQNISKSKKDEIGDEVDVIKTQISGNINQMKGNYSSDFINIFDKLTEISIDPIEIFKSIIAEQAIVVKRQFTTWASPSKKTRHLPGIKLPGRKKIYQAKQGVDLAIVIRDCSGSTAEHQAEFNSVILTHLVPSVNETIIIQHDVDVKKVDRLTRQNTHSDEIFEIVGMGGTSHSDAFQYVDDLEPNEIERISIVVILTDYYSNINEIWGDYKWTKTTPTKVIVPKEYTVDIDPNVDANPIRYSIL